MNVYSVPRTEVVSIKENHTEKQQNYPEKPEEKSPKSSDEIINLTAETLAYHFGQLGDVFGGLNAIA